MKRAENQPTSESRMGTRESTARFTRWPTPGLYSRSIVTNTKIICHSSCKVRRRVWSGDKCLGDFTAPAVVKIEARTFHKFLTLCDDVMIACIHNADHADPNGEPVIAERHDLILED